MKKTYKRTRSIKEVIIDKDHVAFSVYNPFVDYLNTLTAVSAGNENAIARNQIKVNTLLKFMYQTPCLMRFPD